MTNYNVAIIGCAFLGSQLFAQPVYGLALGVVLGGLLQWLFQAIFLQRAGYRLRWRIGLTPEVKKVFRLLLPAIGGLAAVQINIFVITRVASGLGDGPVSYLNFAFRLIFVPLGVFAVAAATVGLARFSECVAAGDTAGALVRWRDSLQLVWYLIIPAAVIFVVFGEDICCVLFQRGAFNAADTQNTASALAFYALGLPAMATIRITAPVFYAHKDTRTPVILSFCAVIANLILIYELVDLLSFRGLALALALAATIQAIGLLTFIRFRYGPYHAPRLAWFFLCMTVFAVLAAVIARNIMPSGEDMLAAIYGIGAIFIAVLLYLLVTWALGYREARFIFGGGKRPKQSG